jgi:hypothetical protein
MQKCIIELYFIIERISINGGLTMKTIQVTDNAARQIENLRSENSDLILIKAAVADAMGLYLRNLTNTKVDDFDYDDIDPLQRLADYNDLLTELSID